MIIFGTRGVTTTPERGGFHCPSCNCQQQYGLKRVRRFFTLYFIPLIPLDMLGEYIECSGCRDTYKTNVLDYSPAEDAAKIEAEYYSAVKKIMIHMLLADGVIDDAEIETACGIYKKMTDEDLDQVVFLEEIAEVERTKEDLSYCLLRLQGSLNDQGKEAVIKAALFVAMADGEFHEEEELVIRIGKYLGMTDAHVQGVIASA